MEKKWRLGVIDAGSGLNVFPIYELSFGHSETAGNAAETFPLRQTSLRISVKSFFVILNLLKYSELHFVPAALRL